MTCLVIYPADRCGDRFSFSIFCPTPGSPFSSVAGSVECSVESQSQISFSGNWLCWSCSPKERRKQSSSSSSTWPCCSEWREARARTTLLLDSTSSTSLYILQSYVDGGSVSVVCMCVCATEATI